MTKSPRAPRSEPKSGSFCPDAGDIVWLDFDPQLGREQAGRRPALVLSPRIYNEKRMVCVACPITSRVRGYPFEVELPSGCGVSGVVLSDQIKCLPWTERRASPAGKVAAATLDQVKARLRALLNL